MAKSPSVCKKNDCRTEGISIFPTTSCKKRLWTVFFQAKESPFPFQANKGKKTDKKQNFDSPVRHFRP